VEHSKCFGFEILDFVVSPTDDFTRFKNVIHFKHRTTFACYQRALRTTLSNLEKPYVIWELLGGVHCSANLQKKMGRDS
jgi:hypothetical protein